MQLFIDGLHFGDIAMCAVGLSLIFGRRADQLRPRRARDDRSGGRVVLQRLGRHPAMLGDPLALVVGAGRRRANDLAIWRPLRRRAPGCSVFIVTIGLSLMLRHLILIIFGGRSRAYAGLPEPAAVDLGLVGRHPTGTASIVISSWCWSSWP